MKRKNLLKAITNNWPYKILSVLISFFLWYFVQGKEVLEVTRKLQVNLIVPKGYMIKQGNVVNKDITIRGPRILLDSSRTRPIEANIKVAPKVGEQTFRIEKRFLRNWNSRLTPTVHDPYIKIMVDIKKSRTLPVKQVTQGLPADGHTIEKISIKPETVVVSGPQKKIDQLTHIPTTAIDISGLQTNRSVEATLFVEEALELSIEKVSVTFQVGETKINKRFAGIPIEIEGDHDLTNLTPRYATIVVQGTPAILNFVKRSELRAFLDARQLPPGAHERKIQVRIPAGTALIETQPEFAKIEILPISPR